MERWQELVLTDDAGTQWQQTSWLDTNLISGYTHLLVGCNAVYAIWENVRLMRFYTVFRFCLLYGIWISQNLFD